MWLGWVRSYVNEINNGDLPLARYEIFDVSVIVSSRGTSRMNHDGEKFIIETAILTSAFTVLVGGFH